MSPIDPSASVHPLVMAPFDPVCHGTRTVVSPPARRKQREDQRPRFELRNAVFVLPNLFTLCSIFCGFYAITLCLEPREADRLYPAAIAIFVGMVLDLFDGRVARLTKTQTEFGRQLDSLADLVSFGTAPGILLYSWSLKTFGGVGLLAAFVYVACGAIRLARFNVLSTRAQQIRAHGGPDVSVGLPIPPAAGTVVAMVLSLHPYRPTDTAGAVVVAIGTGLLGLLMVSNVQYRTFKDLRATRTSIGVIGLLAIGFGAVAVLVQPAVALAAVLFSYVGLGLLEELFGKFGLKRPPSIPRTPLIGGPPPTSRKGEGFTRAEPNNS